jgi:hypothetical protein
MLTQKNSGAPDRGAPLKTTNVNTNNTSNFKQKSAVPQARIELLFEDIGDNTGAMISTLTAALAMRDAGNVPGFLYGLRCAGAYWRNISANARDLVALHHDGGKL